MTTRERLAATLLASLALHALVISGARVPFPEPPDEPRPLQARLAPPPKARPAAVPGPAAKPKPRPPRRAAPAVPVVIAESPVTIAPDPQPEEPVAPAEAPAPPAAQPEPEPPPPAPVRSLPRKGRITYTLFYGSDRFDVGTVVQSWEVEDGGYTLASDARTTGIVDLFRPQRLRYLSQGKVTERGLAPESFLISRTRRGRTDVARARFDWSAGSLTYGYAREPNSAPLPAGAQDFISFIYQFSLFPPPPGRLRLPITTGARFETYEIEVLGEESIETPIGELKTLPLKQVARAGEESIEIWLAADYRYLPVKIRHFGRDGNLSGEQVVSEIQISEE